MILQLKNNKHPSPLLGEKNSQWSQPNSNNKKTTTFKKKLHQNPISLEPKNPATKCFGCSNDSMKTMTNQRKKKVLFHQLIVEDSLGRDLCQSTPPKTVSRCLARKKKKHKGMASAAVEGTKNDVEDKMIKPYHSEIPKRWISFNMRGPLKFPASDSCHWEQTRLSRGFIWVHNSTNSNKVTVRRLSKQIPSWGEFLWDVG